ncbi:MAG: transketolase [Myxococcales bacterium FL481]|nr:MAG: transketolase [Myxococcales bacterium FL481]
MSSDLAPRPVDPVFFEQAVKTIKGLAMDAVEQAKSGHPGMPMGAAHMATTLWTRFLDHDPTAPEWIDRDRFVLSAGHGSMLLYALLHLSGYDLSLEDLQAFRQWNSKTPGHPEFGHTAGVEVTTGPLGTGFAAGVGMAIAERVLADRYNQPGHAIVDHHTYAIVSDGDLMEGVAAEAASLAGHLGLGKLVYLYDDNEISIDGKTDLSFSEDVLARFVAYGWHVQRVDGHDAEAITDAIMAAKSEATKPSLIACRTVIGHGAPTLAGTAKTHGAPLGATEVDAAKRAMGWPSEPFHVPEEVRQGFAALRQTSIERRQRWEAAFAAYRAAHPQLGAEFETVMAGELPGDVLAAIPSFSADDQPIATRKAGAKIVAALAHVHPGFIGGSADLTGSNGVGMPEIAAQSATVPGGRAMFFGVREHGMGAICNGIAAHGGLRPFDATFLVFSDFMRGAVRLAALMKLPVVHVFSHDSFYLGEDGPTHQPIEHTMSLRLIPNLHVVRPADARETAAAWRLGLTRKTGDGPTAILVSRQNLPILPHSREDISCGAYVLSEADGPLDGILIASGSEVSLALLAQRELAAAGTHVRVVSMPCWEAFDAQPQSYRDEVLPPALTRRLSIEAGTTLGWSRYASASIGIDHFGASAPADELARQFGFTVEGVVARYQALH